MFNVHVHSVCGSPKIGLDYMLCPLIIKKCDPSIIKRL